MPSTARRRPARYANGAVGRPIHGTEIELLPADTDLPGVGELCLISGDLALGYVRSDSGFTRFDLDAGGRPRLRTGDLARLTADGEAELGDGATRW